MRLVLPTLIAAALTATPASAETVPPAAKALAPGDRIVPAGRIVLVEVPQSEIAADVDIGRTASDASYGGGLIGALILSAADTKQQRLTKIAADKATAHAAPVRNAMSGFDFAAPALNASRAGLTPLDWFAAREIRLVRTDGREPLKSLAMAAPQPATLTYRYSLSPDFTQIRVIADLVISRRTGSDSTALFQQRITAISELRDRSYDLDLNAARWSADGGALARAAVTDATARIGRLLPLALSLTQAQIDALGRSKQAKVFAAGLYGAPVAGADVQHGETLLWSRGLVSVVPVPATP